MRTIVTNSVKVAARFIKNGELAAFPTETVYGLGANAYDKKAIKKIFKAKGRPADNPLIVHIAYKKDINVLAKDIPEAAKKIIRKFFPGPITVILRKNEIIPDAVTAGLDTIAIRMPSSKIARDFIKECAVPVAAPSANISGSPSPTSFHHVLQDFSGKIPCILAGGKAKHGLESTVIDCTVNPSVVLRPGVITIEQLKKIDTRIKFVSKHGKVKSPGTKYKHYSPEAKVVLVKSKKAKVNLISDFGFEISDLERSAYIGLNKPPKGLGLVKVCKSETDYARSLFAFFRECDAKRIKTIYCQKVPEKGVGLAIMNRLKKAAK